MSNSAAAAAAPSAELGAAAASYYWKSGSLIVGGGAATSDSTIDNQSVSDLFLAIRTMTVLVGEVKCFHLEAPERSSCTAEGTFAGPSSGIARCTHVQ